MKLIDCLKHIGKPTFEEQLTDELQSNAMEVPLEDFCEHGGSPDEDTLEIAELECTDEGDQIAVSMTVYFDESVPSSCSEVNFPEPATGDLSCHINKTTGVVSWERSRRHH